MLSRYFSRKRYTVRSQKEKVFICITDIAGVKNSDRPDDLVRNCLKNRNTIESLVICEHLNRPDFNPVEFEGIKMLAGSNSFALTPKQWIEKTNTMPLNSPPGYRWNSSPTSSRNFSASRKMKTAAVDFPKSWFHPLPSTPSTPNGLIVEKAIVAEIEAEQSLVAANRELIVRFEKKIQATFARVWGEASAN